MKTNVSPGRRGQWQRILRSCGLALLGLASPLLCPAQPFEVGWTSVDGGNGQFGGGSFSASGCLGVAAGEASAGGSFDVQPGLWPPPSVAAPETPSLKIALVGNRVVLSWPAQFEGFVLQQTPVLPTHVWNDVPAPVVAVGELNMVTLPGSAGNWFYRLKK